MRWFAILILGMLFSLGCGKKKGNGVPTLPSAQSGSQGSFKNGIVEFRQGFAVGYRVKYEGELSAADARMMKPTRITETTECELIRVEDGNFVWKITTSDRITDKGDGRGYIQIDGPLENYVSFETLDSVGNLVKTERRQADEAERYDAFPRQPVRVGESWTGYGVKRGKRYEEQYLLESVDSSSGRPVAVIQRDSFGPGRNRTTSKTWVDIATGLKLKCEESGSCENFEGEMMTGKGSWVGYDSNGVRLLQ